MATVAILISDLSPGPGIQVDVRSDEPMSEDSESLTPAQGVALAATMFLGSIINGDDDVELEAEAPSLEVVGDVE